MPHVHPGEDPEQVIEYIVLELGSELETHPYIESS